MERIDRIETALTGIIDHLAKLANSEMDFFLLTAAAHTHHGEGCKRERAVLLENITGQINSAAELCKSWHEAKVG